MGRISLLLLTLFACGDPDTPRDPKIEPSDPTDSESQTPQEDFPDGPVMVRITATYDRPATTAWDGLDYDDMSTLPIRGAEFWVLADGELVAEGTTNEMGEAEFETPPGANLDIGVAARSPDYDLNVVDNTANNALWTLVRSFDAPTSDVASFDIHAGLEHDGVEYTTRASAPFAILDTMLGVTRRVDELVSKPIPELYVHWSPFNRPVSGDITEGRIGTTKHVWQTGIFVLGAEDVDTDEYDETVLAHEWFHFFEHAFSRSDSEGGSHGSSSILQMSTAWSEGSVTALGNHILGVRGYRDSNDPAQADSWENDLERNRIGSAIGWYGERSISSLLWDLTDAEQDEADHLVVPTRELFSVLTGPFAESPALTSIHAFGHAVLVQHPEHADNISGLWEREDVVAPTDPWGTGEVNDGGDPESLPLYRSLVPGETEEIDSMGPASSPGNRSHDFRYYRFTSPAETRWRVEISGSEDVDLFIVHRGDTLCSSRSRSGDESCEFNATQGEDYVIEIDGSYLDEVSTPVTVTLRETP